METAYTNAMDSRYQAIFENTGTATIIIEADMTISMCNAKFVRLTGYSKQEIEGRLRWDKFVSRADLDKMRRYHLLRRQDPSSAPTEYECSVVDRHGVVKNILLTIDMIAGTDKSVASFMDITTVKQARKALVESERRLTTLMDNLPGMAYRRLNDADWTMVFVSRGCAGLTGYSPAELTGPEAVPYRTLIHPDDRQTAAEAVRKALAEKRNFKLMYRIATADGRHKWVWEQGQGVFDTAGGIPALEGFVTDITDRKREELALKRENRRLRSTIKERYRFGNIIGKSGAMQAVYENILKAAAGTAGVIIYGESGTGKELVAQAIHENSERANHRFVPVNCGAIPENLLESELFGYRKGAFTGAAADKRGFLDLAEGGTLFLDEVGEIGLNMQIKLLRAIEGGGYTPIGAEQVKTPDVRVIAATHKNLTDNVEKGFMREDFFYRIHVIPLQIPPLRDRREDIPLLVDHFVKQYPAYEKQQAIPTEVLETLCRYDWPGNVRELQNVLHRYLTLNRLDFLPTRSMAPTAGTAAASTVEAESPAMTLRAAMDEFEQQYVSRALEACRWHKGKVASVLDIDRKTLFRKLRKYGIER